MNIFLLFVFNVFTGALIYLILTLKIEKNSATFQEKKLKREMAEIIREFNSTAERNISILENHISTLKKLMNENGTLRGIDFTVLDNQLRNNTERNSSSGESYNKNPAIVRDINKDTVRDKLNSLTEDHNVMSSFMEWTYPLSDDNSAEENNGLTVQGDRSYKNGKESKIDLYSDEEIAINYEEKNPVDINDLFNNTEDKYMLIAKLYNEGHSVEELSKYSGLPSGEIKLVISLNS